MTTTLRSNDPCHCGSGKRYIHCHLREDQALAAQAADSHEGAVQRAIAWLVERHRKGFKTAFDALTDSMLPADAGRDTFAHLDDEVLGIVQINLTEWMLAEGEIFAKGAQRRVCEYLLGSDGPGMSPKQRAWLMQLGEQPLRLHTVTDVHKGEGVTLCDALDMQAPPVQVRERAGSASMTPGMLIGCRVMRLPNHNELSGAIYPFSQLAAQGMLAQARAVADSMPQADNQRALMSYAIMTAWLRQYLEPPPMPKLVDAQTGEALLLVTDHYRVLDPATLAQALATCTDVSGDAQAGWLREFEGEDGQWRTRAAINPGKQPDRIELFYRTQRHADEGRAWFDALAGSSVQFLAREITDPVGAMSKPGKASAASAPESSLSPDAMAEAIEQVLLRSYANWADDPIPALDHKTPRQAIQSASGLERVKGLLRSYESGEADMAARQGRRTISYQFLWDALGIAR
ncbi:MAG: SEC-C domain-containing protein [Burkholderiaceae bacterium]